MKKATKTTTKAAKKAATMPKEKKAAKAATGTKKASSKPETAAQEDAQPLPPFWVNLNDGKSMTQLIEMLVDNIAKNEDSRQSFNKILAAASNDKLQLMEVKAAKGKSKKQ